MIDLVLYRKEDKNYLYGFNPVISHLLSLTSGIDSEIIQNVEVYQRHFLRYIPWYSKSKGGGAITLGSGKKQSITFTENFFAFNTHTDPDKFILMWLSLASHEVIHINHAKKYNNLLVYLWAFAIQYMRHGHDGAPNEKEADKGTSEFNRFNAYVNYKYGYNALSALLKSDLKDDEKKKQIDLWWQRYSSGLTD